MKARNGVTLVEVLVAMMVVLLAGLACIQVLQFSTKSALASFKRIQAAQYFDQIHHHLELSNLDTLSSRYTQFPQIFSDSDYSAEVFIGTTSYDGSRLAEITVRWQPNPDENFLKEEVTLAPR